MEMNLGLNGKVALVTGAGSPIGYGKTIAAVLAQEGCAVAAADLSPEWAQRTANEIGQIGGRAISVAADVRIRTEV
jgi:NAD(P)-dependent dehydrogenase (short-subunit alcohol dehydrogenase family)